MPDSFSISLRLVMDSAAEKPKKAVRRKTTMMGMRGWRMIFQRIL